MKSKLTSILFILVLCQSLTMAWTVPVPVSELNTGYLQDTPFISADGKSLYFSRADGPTSYNQESIYVATRQDTSGPFTSITRILSDSYHARSPWVSADGLRMYYHNESSRWTIKVSSRASINAPWQIGTGISEINRLGAVLHPELAADEKTIFFQSLIGGNWGYWTASRADVSSPFGGFRELTEIMLPGDGSGSVSPDGLTIYFPSGRNGTSQMFKATRNSINDLFSNLEHLSAFDQPIGSSAGFPNISADGKTLYLCISTPDRPCDIYVSYNPEPAALLQSIKIVGPNSVPEESDTQYQVIGYYDNGSSKDVTADVNLSVEPDEFAQIDSNGLLTTFRLYRLRELCTIYADYQDFSMEMPVEIYAICDGNECTMPQLLKRNIADAIEIKQGIAEDLDYAMKIERASMQMLPKMANGRQITSWQRIQLIKANIKLLAALAEELWAKKEVDKSIDSLEIALEFLRLEKPGKGPK